jgi:hypothetical protein
MAVSPVFLPLEWFANRSIFLPAFLTNDRNDSNRELPLRSGRSHSALSATIGSIIAALRAGRMPESTPTAPETATARKTAQNER